jgi:hypothetical protein
MKNISMRGSPIEFSWLNREGSEDFTKLVDYTEGYRPGAGRFDAGASPAFINIPMAKAALIQILKWGVSNIQETLAVLTAQMAALGPRAGFTCHRHQSCRSYDWNSFE